MLGKVLLTLDAVLLLFGAPIADYNHTHIFNPKWPPHAKFHDAQTINISVMLGVATLFFTWRPTATAEMAVDSLRVAGFTGSIYWLAAFGAILYPGTSGLDPEFGGPGFPQRVPFGLAALFGIMGSLLGVAAIRT